MTGPQYHRRQGMALARGENAIEDETVTKVVTNGDGQFVLNGVGDYETAIAVSTPGLDLWLYEPVPALGKPCEIVLPATGQAGHPLRHRGRRARGDRVAPLARRMEGCPE